MNLAKRVNNPSMPKFILFLALCICLVTWHYGTLCNPHLESLGDGEFRIFSRELVHSPLIENRIATALGFIYITSSQNAHILRAKFTHIDGESITLFTPQSADQIIRRLGYHVVESSHGSVIRTTYAHSARGRNFITSDGRRINLQIIERGNVVTVGWPVVLGGG